MTVHHIWTKKSIYGRYRYTKKHKLYIELLGWCYCGYKKSHSKQIVGVVRRKEVVGKCSCKNFGSSSFNIKEYN